MRVDDLSKINPKTLLSRSIFNFLFLKLFARSKIVHAAASAGIDVLDVPYLDLENMDGMKKEAILAKNLGFSGKGSIHPKQIKILNDVFTPSETEIKQAEKIVDEFEKSGKGLLVIDGKLIEKPVALQLGGSSPKLLSNATKVGESFGYDEINLNLGCPSKKVQKNKFGACLMQEPGLVAKCIEAMTKATKLPVTIKTRIGYNDVENFDFLKSLISDSSQHIEVLKLHLEIFFC